MSKQHYRADIDGLRAIAVLIVVLFHAKLGCPGGYIGVDVFFVISGFLITTLILTDLEKGTFSLVGFWERRARRIVPALITVTIVTLIGGWFLLFPDDFRNLGASAMAQAGFAANVFFWRETGYFKAPAEEKPLLHTWSLAVEEQFYLVVPLTLFLCYKSKLLNTRQRLLLLAALAGIASFALSCYGVANRRTGTFYLLPTRSWELLCGCMLAIFPPTWFVRKRLLNEVLSYVGMAGIIVPAFLYDRQTPFPGFAALPPCLGTALIVYSNSHSRSEVGRATSLGEVLSLRPVVFVGLISYSLYLWHWPMFAYSRYWFPYSQSMAYRMGVVFVALILAVVSWRYVESPFRKRVVCGSRPAVLKFAVAGLATVFVLGIASRLLSDAEFRIPQQAQLYAAGKQDMAFINELSVRDVSSNRLVPLGETNTTGEPALLVWGDSHAMAILPAFDALAKQFRIKGVAVTRSATAPVYTGYPFNPGKGLKGDVARKFGRSVLDYVELHKIQQVVLVAYWSGYCEPQSDTDESRALAGNVDALVQGLVETVVMLQNKGATVWILEEVPRHRVPVPRILAWCSMWGVDADQFAAKVDDSVVRSNFTTVAHAALSEAGAKWVSVAPLLLTPDGKHYRMSDGTDALYRDRGHLSVKGALFVAGGLSVIFDNLSSVGGKGAQQR